MCGQGMVVMVVMVMAALAAATIQVCQTNPPGLFWGFSNKSNFCITFSLFILHLACRHCCCASEWYFSSSSDGGGSCGGCDSISAGHGRDRGRRHRVGHIQPVKLLSSNRRKMFLVHGRSLGLLVAGAHRVPHRLLEC